MDYDAFYNALLFLLPHIAIAYTTVNVIDLIAAYGYTKIKERRLAVIFFVYVVFHFLSLLTIG